MRWETHRLDSRRFTPYQSKDPSLTIPTYRTKENIKQQKTKTEREAYANKKALALMLRSDSPTPLSTSSQKSFHRDTERGIRVLWYIYPEWPHRQSVGLAYPWTRVRAQLLQQVLRFVARNYTVQYVELRGYCP